MGQCLADLHGRKVGIVPGIPAKLRGKNFIVINDFGWPISPDHYGKIVDRVAEKAGIRKIHPHMFRPHLCQYPALQPGYRCRYGGGRGGPCPAQHDTGNLYAGLPQAAGFHPQPDERDALQEKNSRKMKETCKLYACTSLLVGHAGFEPAITRL